MGKGHKMARSLGYLPQPGMSAGAGVGSALGAFGQTVSNLGQLSIDDKDKKAKTEMENMKLDLLKNADKRGDEELKLKADEVSGKNQYYDEKAKTERQKLLDEAIKSGNRLAAMKIAHPKFTEALVAAVGEKNALLVGDDIDKYIPKDREVGHIDPRITPDGTKYVTFFDKKGGQINEVNLGKVKTDWNEGKDKPSSEIPSGHVAVDLDYTKANFDKGTLKQTKDGRYYDSLDNVNQWEAKNPVLARNPIFNQDPDAEQKPRQKFKLPPVEYTDEEKARDLEITGTMGSDGKKIKGKYTW